MLEIFGNSQTCGACIELKRHLDANNLQYKYNDLSIPDNKVRIGYKKRLKEMGISHIPVGITPSGDVLEGLDDIKKYFE